jgi:ABC-type branched-subunit amino acid transport system ATPase component
MLLEVEELIAGYGRITILNGVNLKVSTGEIVCLIGPNGAGKSTLLRAIIGQILPSEGRVVFDGEDITALNPEHKGHRGLVFIPQGDNIFPNLSLLENLEIAGYLVRDRQVLRRRIQEVFEMFPWMGEQPKRAAHALSGGQRQMLALARTLLLQPRLVLLDEPSLGLAPLAVQEIFDRIQALNQRGVSFLLVEQNARKGLSASHRGYVLEQGLNRLEGTGRELLSTPEVQKLYLGG